MLKTSGLPVPIILVLCNLCYKQEIVTKLQKFNYCYIIVSCIFEFAAFLLTCNLNFILMQFTKEVVGANKSATLNCNNFMKNHKNKLS
jgi:hypothetical protein